MYMQILSINTKEMTTMNHSGSTIAIGNKNYTVISSAILRKKVSHTVLSENDNSTHTISIDTDSVIIQCRFGQSEKYLIA